MSKRKTDLAYSKASGYPHAAVTVAQAKKWLAGRSDPHAVTASGLSSEQPAPPEETNAHEDRPSPPRAGRCCADPGCPGNDD